MAMYEAIDAQLQNLVSDEAGRLIMKCEEARVAWASLEWQMFAETVFCHFPGIAPALRQAWLHAIDQYSDERGTCCSDGIVPW